MVCATAFECAGGADSGWRLAETVLPEAVPMAGNLELPALASAAAGESAGFSMLMSGGEGAVTPEIAALAADLHNDPVLIFNFVRSRIDFQPYYGSLKGAQGTLLERAGNAWDQSNLLVALLRAAGVEEVEYVFGIVQVRDWNANGNDLERWLGVRRQMVQTVMAGTPAIYALGNGGSYLLYAFEHVWVRAVIGGTVFHLDPSYKRSTPQAGLALAALSGFDKAELLAAAGGVEDSLGISGMDRQAVEEQLAEYAGTLRSALVAGNGTASIEEVIGGRLRIATGTVPLEAGGPLAEFSPFVIRYAQEMGAADAATYCVEVGTAIVESFRTDELGSRRLTVSFGTQGQAQLWLDDALVAEEAAPDGGSVTLRLSIDHPRNTAAASPGPDLDSELAEQTLLRTGLYDVTPSLVAYWRGSGRLEASHKRLAQYLAAGFEPQSREVMAESLHNLRLKWVGLATLGVELAAQVRRGFSTAPHLLGLAGQEDGFFVDILSSTNISLNATGNDLGLLRAQAGMLSAFEHVAVEQAGAPRAVSTVRALVEANEQGQRIFKATGANWAAVSAELANYPQDALTSFGSEVAANATLLVHEDGALSLDEWTGFGYALLKPTSANMKIAGGLNGGLTTVLMLIDGQLVLATFFGDLLLDVRVLGTPEAHSAEPVDLRTGAYLFRKTDLALGRPDSPWGLDFRRSYDSSRAGTGSLGRGWTHSCHGRITLGSSPESAFGLLRSRDAAPMLVAALAAIEFADLAGSAKDLMLWVFASQWAADATTANAAYVEMGDERLLFSRTEGGGWSRPAGTRSELEGSSGNFTLRPHLRGSIGFDTQNRIAFWDDPDGNRRSWAYDDEGRLETVTDAANRSFTFSYNGTSPLIETISDSTGRSIGFTYNGSLLESATDPENHTSTFGYDGEGRLDLWTDPLGQPVARNFYDTAGRVVRQHSRGDPEQEWMFSYRPGVSTETDPDGRSTTWLFDSQGRLGAVRDALGNTPFVIYDAANRLTHSYDARGYLTRFYHDSADNLWARQNPFGHVAYFGHDGHGRLEWALDESGRLVVFGYDSEHHLRSATDAGNRTTTYEPYPNGLLHQITEPGNRVTTFSYDAWGTPSGILRADGNTTASAFNARGDLVSLTDARGHTTAFGYDNRRLPTSRTDATGNTTFTSHDANGYPASVTDRRGFTTHTPADNFGLVQAVSAPATATANLTYDTRDLLVARTNGLGHTTQWLRDDAGRIESLVDGLDRTTATLGYDADARLTSRTNGESETTLLAYDARGFLGNRTDGAGRKTSYTHDAAGRRTGLLNARGASFGFGYGTDGQQDTLDYPGGRQRRILERDERGLPRLLRSPAGHDTTLFHDDLGRVVTQVDEEGTISWVRDADGNPEHVIEGNATISRAFDALGRITACTDTLGNTVGYRYDAEGNVEKVIYPDGKEVTYTYDGAGRMQTVTDWAGRATTYFYDAIGRLERVERPNGTIGRFTWDAANRLEASREMKGGITIWRADYGYDGADRIVRLDQIPPANILPPPPTTMTFALDNRMETYNGESVPSDLDGNMLAAPLGGTLLGNLTWDARNRLTSATTAGGNATAYTYDAENRRVRSMTATGNTTYTWSRGTLDRLLVKANPDGSTTRYIHGLGLLYEEHEPAGGGNTTVQFYHYNWQGSTVTLTDATGTVTARIGYTAYGTHTVFQGSTDTPFLFNGQFGVMTEPHGLLQMMARFYSPVMCRFLSEDPSGFAGGDNFYAYAAGDPINLMDPFGLGPVNTMLDGMGSVLNDAISRVQTVWMNNGSIDVTYSGGRIGGGSLTVSFFKGGFSVTPIVGFGYGAGGSLSFNANLGTPSGMVLGASLAGGNFVGGGQLAGGSSFGGRFLVLQEK